MKIRRYTPRTEKECRNIAISFIELQQENHQLKDRIEKAIELIDNWHCFECDKGTMREISFDSNKENILEILKGEEND